MGCFFWVGGLTAGGPPGEGHLGVKAGASAASGLDVTEVWLELRAEIHPHQT